MTTDTTIDPRPGVLDIRAERFKRTGREYPPPARGPETSISRVQEAFECGVEDARDLIATRRKSLLNAWIRETTAEVGGDPSVAVTLLAAALMELKGPTQTPSERT